ncbi:AAA family ATPase [Rossellomorea sp. NPDC071047]|uniref:ATP-dependent nuclease n=1 Tax=Rossellomorea sp. NPDC071047 TaxID=3390675 RepID=UPI003D076DEC
MLIPDAPYISRVQIQNFRNFKSVDVKLTHKQIIIGENNVGKTNFLRTIQLILDPKLSDEDRFLNENDFFEELESPMEQGEEVKISIDIRGFEHNKTLLAILSDATIKTVPATLRLTYHYYATKKIDGSYEYQFKIYQGEKEDVPFNHLHRKYLNIKVIPAIRDVESELKNTRKSPINQLLNHYDIRKEELKDIADRLKETSDEVLSIDELVHLTSSINNRFSTIIGQHADSSISLETIDLDPNRILNTLKLMVGQGQRPVSDTSLGLNNILYISLILISLEDKTISPILKEETYLRLLEEEGCEIVKDCYEQNDNKNYILKDEITPGSLSTLYSFMDTNIGQNNGFTILAIEEPEAHLHPALQRLIFKDVMKQNTSILMTTHSPHITSVAPVNSIVHLRTMSYGTKVKTTASLNLSDRDCKDLERYVDVKKGEIYFGKGVILVEGIAEEYLIPSFAESLHMPLDKKGIICCNINSTNFKPYVQFLDALGIPYVAITDGDYYHRINKNKNVLKVFGDMYENHHSSIGYDGLDRIKKLLIDTEKIEEKDYPTTFRKQDKLCSSYGFFIGEYTFEIDMMETAFNNNFINVFADVFNDLTFGGPKQKQNFKSSLDAKDYVSCLNKIESKHSRIGKGRFAQGLSSECINECVPPYIEEAIKTIFAKMDDL